jgi:hypothetical protein
MLNKHRLILTMGVFLTLSASARRIPYGGGLDFHARSAGRRRVFSCLIVLASAVRSRNKEN